MILLDTCALIWWTLDPEHLSKPAADACAEVERTGGFISSISIWEIGVKIKNKKLDIGIPLSDFVSRLHEMRIVKIVPVDETIWLENLALDWPNRDPADRTIVATAKRQNLPIVTKDRRMAAFYENVIW